MIPSLNQTMEQPQVINSTLNTNATLNTSQQENELLKLKSKLRMFHNFPKPNIQFYDIFSLFHDPNALNLMVQAFQTYLHSIGLNSKINVILGIEARGFLFAPFLAHQMKCKFAPVRKANKLPGKLIRSTYSKEYGEDIVEIQEDAIRPGDSVVILDDLIATGGSAKAAGELVRLCGGKVIMHLFAIELVDLQGRKELNGPVYSLFSL